MPLEPGLTASVTLVVDDADTALALRQRRRARARHAAGDRARRAGDGRGARRASCPKGRTTVGYQVQLAHLTPTPVGGTVVAEATLEQIEGRRLTFRVAVNDARGLVAAGRITRVIVERGPVPRADPDRRSMTRRARCSLVERADEYATLTLNRPEKRNALSVRAPRRDQRRARRARRRSPRSRPS